MEGTGQQNVHSATIEVEKLSLNNEEDELEIDIDGEVSEVKQQSFSLVGRFLTNRPIRVQMMMRKMGDIWQPGRGMDIEEVYPGLFVFRFFHQIDVQRILKQGPWSFDNHTLVLNILPDDTEPLEIPLVKVPFWIQVHNLPTGFMSQKVGKNIAEYIGEFLEYDEKNDSLAWRRYMCIRVLVDIRLPLKKSKKIKKPGGEGKMVLVKYERLGTFCYLCGLLGHSDTYCPKLFEIEVDDGSREWSPELRAEGNQRSGGGSRWIREAGNPNWVAPNPVFGSSNCSNGKGETQGRNHDKQIITINEDRGEKNKLAEVFRNPQKLFPKHEKAVKSVINEEEKMEEDEDEALMIEGDRKRMRNQEIIASACNHGHETTSSSGSHENATYSCTHENNFLMAGPGGARQGQ